jgi:hypothetical protein
VNIIKIIIVFLLIHIINLKLINSSHSAQLEAEIENLSWKIERAETTDRGEIENQMDICEKRRLTLLKDFFPTTSTNTTTATSDMNS